MLNRNYIYLTLVVAINGQVLDQGLVWILGLFGIRPKNIQWKEVLVYPILFQMRGDHNSFQIYRSRPTGSESYDPAYLKKGSYKGTFGVRLGTFIRNDPKSRRICASLGLL